MKRYKITNELRKAIENSKYSIDKISKLLGFNVKNIYYRNISINENHLKKLSSLLNINISLKEIEFNYSKNLGNYSITAKIKPIKENKYLAEFIGIMLGDGNIYKNQITISFDKRDKEYISYIKKLNKKLFGINLKLKLAKKINLAQLYCYNKKLTEELIRFGLKRGNKIKNNLGVPQWIKNNPRFIKRCIKGLIDTDGCIYRCKREKQTYIKFTNFNTQLLNDFKEITTNLGYSFAKANKRNACLYRKREVVNFINEIKPFKMSGVVV